MISKLTKYYNEILGYKFSDFHHGNHIFFYGAIFSDELKLQIGIEIFGDTVDRNLLVSDIFSSKKYSIHSIVIDDKLHYKKKY